MAGNSILLNVFTPIRREAKANSGNILPGCLVAYQSDGDFDVAATSLGGRPPVALVATEDELQGKSISDAYTSGSIVTAYHLRAGDRVQLRGDGGGALAIGDFVTPVASGRVGKLDVAISAGETGAQALGVVITAETNDTAGDLVEVEII